VIQINTTRVAAACLLAASLSGCAAIEDFLAPLGDPAVESVAAEPLPPIEERPRLEPQNRNTFVLESPDQSVIGEPQVVFTSEEHTFSDLAREYGLGYDEIVEANPDIDPWLPGEGTPVLLPTQFVLPEAPRSGIVLNIASKRLFYFPAVEEGEPQVVMTYPIGIGRVGWETPLGSSTVIAKARDPQWYVPASVRREHEELGDPLPAVVPPGPDNPLGRHVLKLDIPGYLIHGTNAPAGVGMRVSHGCVRLYPENIELLYDLVAVGETVSIINEPFLVGTKDGDIYFEAHAPLEDDPVNPDTRLADRLGDIEGLAAEQGTRFSIETLRAAADAGLGVPVRLTGADDIMARSRIVENTVQLDPEMPTLAEVREILDAPAEDEVDASPAVAQDDGQSAANE
jgi:L,D-transpeptidase ErfK/SrfK